MRRTDAYPSVGCRSRVPHDGHRRPDIRALLAHPSLGPRPRITARARGRSGRGSARRQRVPPMGRRASASSRPLARRSGTPFEPRSPTSADEAASSLTRRYPQHECGVFPSERVKASFLEKSELGGVKFWSRVAELHHCDYFPGDRAGMVAAARRRTPQLALRPGSPQTDRRLTRSTPPRRSRTTSTATPLAPPPSPPSRAIDCAAGGFDLHRMRASPARSAGRVLRRSRVRSIARLCRPRHRIAVHGEHGRAVSARPVAGCRVFPHNNWWNTDISAAPRHARSDAWLRHMSPRSRLHPDFGRAYGEQRVPYGIPITVVGAGHRKVNVASDTPARATASATPSAPTRRSKVVVARTETGTRSSSTSSKCKLTRRRAPASATDAGPRVWRSVEPEVEHAAPRRLDVSGRCGLPSCLGSFVGARSSGDA